MASALPEAPIERSFSDRHTVTPKVANRGSIAPFIVMDVMRAANERAAEGEDVLHLEVGQPGTPAPLPVLEAAKAAWTRCRLILDQLNDGLHGGGAGTRGKGDGRKAQGEAGGETHGVV